MIRQTWQNDEGRQMVTDLDLDEYKMVQGALELGTKEVKDVMTRIQNCYMLEKNTILSDETLSDYFLAFIDLFIIYNQKIEKVIEEIQILENDIDSSKINRKIYDLARTVVKMIPKTFDHYISSRINLFAYFLKQQASTNSNYSIPQNFIKIDPKND